MFTFNLPESFVNVKSPISTDICRVLPKLFPYRPIFIGFTAFSTQKKGFLASTDRSVAAASSL
jgi:hypothetical protein